MTQHSQLTKCLLLVGALAVVAIAHGLAFQDDEPFFNNDETRHIMTGVFFRDLLIDLPLTHPREYAVSYYLQYPAVGLLVWPPLFHFLEGLAMVIFGMSSVVPQILIGLFVMVACAYLFLLVRQTHDQWTAAVAVLIFAFSPLVFLLSSYVMLEIPTLALSLAATYHLMRYLDRERGFHLLFAALASVLAALTRFDAVYLLPFFLLLIGGRRFDLLARARVCLTAALAVLLVLPFYALSAAYVGASQLQTVTDTLEPGLPPFFSFWRLVYYPRLLPSQIGWFILIPAVIGLLAGLRAARRPASWPYLAMIAATYLTFTPIGEMESRHTIYWVPAFSLFAAAGVARLGTWLRRDSLRTLLAGIMVVATVWTTWLQPRPTLRGYEQAALHVLSKAGTSPACLFVGGLNGNFIYQIRRHDPERRVWVLRADRIPIAGPGDQPTAQRVLATIFTYDPRFIVVEEPPASFELPIDDVFRAVLRDHPERFRLETAIRAQSNDPILRGVTLKIYRNILKNPNPERWIEARIPLLRDTLRTIRPPIAAGETY